mgnify:CR=1 FL=1
MIIKSTTTLHAAISLLKPTQAPELNKWKKDMAIAMLEKDSTVIEYNDTNSEKEKIRIIHYLIHLHKIFVSSK